MKPILHQQGKDNFFNGKISTKFSKNSSIPFGINNESTKDDLVQAQKDTSGLHTK